MPGRVSARKSNASALSRKSSVPTLSSRTSTTSRISAPAVIIPDEGPSSALRAQICAIFGDAQTSTAGHRKLLVNLRKIQEACCYEPSKPAKIVFDDFGEDDFNVEMARCVIRLMGVKKSEGVGDRIVRFLGLFLRHACDKDAALIPESDNDETQNFPETPSTRLTSHILSILLPLLASKEKIVRYRSTQLISHIVNSLDSIDDEYYHMLKAGLVKRVKDKEAMVRVQAVLGLGRLAGNEGEEERDADSESDDDSGLLERLLQVLQNDSSAEVRRSLLLNLPLTPATLPFLLERARDLDPATRRALYSRLLPALGDFRHLSLSMREKILRWGLRDRDENVRNAAARLFRERWIEDCTGTRTSPQDGEEAGNASPSIDGLLELLERIDVLNSGADDGIALEAMREFWDGRPDYRDAVSFDDPFWDHLSAESVFMARSFNSFCLQSGGKHDSLVEEKMPEVTKLAFFFQRYTNQLIERLRHNSALGDGEEEEDTVEQEFIVEQLLYIAQTLDYTDEIGRRKMFALLRDALAVPELPDEITKLVVEVLRNVCGNDFAAEREFCGVVLEAVAEVHDTITNDESITETEDESFHSARSELSDSTPTQAKKKIAANAEANGKDEKDEEKVIKEIMINMKCLHIAQCMLQNVDASLQQNAHLVTMLNNLVVPAVRSHEAPLRERGLNCLGLCCLLDKVLSEENLTLFLHCFNKGHDSLQVTAIHTLSDILTTHPTLLSTENSDETLQRSIFKVFSKGLKASHTPDVQAAATIALSKLMLTAVIEDEDLLRQLVVCYFDPSTKDNAAVRQALSYFLPVYCHSRRENMVRMASIVPSAIHTLVSLGEELEEDEEMVGLVLVGNMLVDWTDARKLVVQDQENIIWDEAGRREAKAVNGDIHLSLAEELLEKAMSHGCSREEKKPLLLMLGKLYVTLNSDPEKLRNVLDLATEALEIKTASEASSRNAVTKLQSALSKAIGEAGTVRKSIEDEGMTNTPGEGLDGGDGTAEAEGSGSGEETRMEVPEVEPTEMKDTLLEELLDEEEEEL